MLCGNCGKEIPEQGRVCPYCHADKSYDQSVLGIAYFLIVGGGGIGWWVGGSREIMIGLGVGFVLSLIVLVINMAYRKSHPIQSKPEER